MSIISKLTEDTLRNYRSTGLVSGGIITINSGDNSKIDISDGKGLVVDNYTNPETPKVYKVSWVNKTSITLDNLATSLRSYIAFNKDGNIVQQTSLWTPEEKRDLIILGTVLHPNNVSIESTESLPITQFDLNLQIVDFIEAIGSYNVSGNVFSANGSNLNIDKSVGEIFRIGSNYDTDRQNPSISTIAVDTALTFRYRYQDGLGGFNEGSNTITIDPTKYDDGSGTLASVPSSNPFQIQRIYLFSTGEVRIMPGQNTYKNMSDATASMIGEVHISDPNLLANALFRGWLIVDKSCVNLTNSSEARFIASDAFGNTAAGGSSFSTTTLQGAYNNSTEPEIVTNATLGAVTLKGGTGNDTDNNLEIKNNSGSITATITAEGNLTANNFSGSSSGSNTGDQDLSGLQPLNANLTAIASLANTDGNFIVGSGSTWVAENGSTARTSLGLGAGNDVTFKSIINNGYFRQGASASDSWFYSNVGFGNNQTPGEAIDVTGNIAVSGTVDGRDIATDGTKLDGLVIGTTVQAHDTNLDNLASYFRVTGSGTLSNFQGNSNDAKFGWYRADATTHDIIFYGENSGGETEYARFDGSSKYFGVGVTIPDAKTHFYDSDPSGKNGVVGYFQRNGAGDVGISFSQSGVNSFAIIHPTGGGLEFFHNRYPANAGTSRMKITNDGNLELSGELDLGGNNIDNVGEIQLDDIRKEGIATGPNVIDILGQNTDTDLHFRFRLTGSSPRGYAGCIFSTFNDSHYFLHANESNELEILYSTENSTNPDRDNASQIASISNTNLSYKGQYLNVGVNDSTGGVLRLYGNDTANNEGGEIRLYTAADHDTSIDYYVIDAYQDDLRIFSNSDVHIQISGGNVGIGQASPQNKLDIEGALAVGSTPSGSTTAPTNGAIIQGDVKIGLKDTNEGSSVNKYLDVYAGNGADSYISALEQHATLRYGGYISYDGGANDIFIGSWNAGTATNAIKIDRGTTTVTVLENLDVGSSSTDGRIRVISNGGRRAVFEADDSTNYLHIGSDTGHDFRIVRNNVRCIEFNSTSITFHHMTNGVEVARLSDDGHLGVNTSSTTHTLNVTNSEGNNINGIYVYGSDSTSYPNVLMENNSGTQFDIGVNPSGESDPSMSYLWNYQNYAMKFGTNNTERMRITNGGQVLIGTISDLGGSGEKLVISDGTQKFAIKPGYKQNTVNSTHTTLEMPGIDTLFVWDNFEISDNAYKPGGGSWSSSSDERLKEDIQPIENALEKLCKLKGVTFKWKNPHLHNTRDIKDYDREGGFIAQDVEQVFPKWVKNRTDAFAEDEFLIPKGEKVKTLDLPYEFDAYVIEAIKELNNKINKLIEK